MTLDSYLDVYRQDRENKRDLKKISNTNDAENIILQGRKLVFSKNMPSEKYGNYIGIGFILILFIMSISIYPSYPNFEINEYLWWFFIINSIGLGIGIVFFFIAYLEKKPKRNFFYILGPEGIVVKKTKQNPKFIHWNIIKNLTSHEEIAGVKTRYKIMKVEIELQNEDIIKISSNYLKNKEFPKARASESYRKLFTFVFEKYFENYKDK